MFNYKKGAYAERVDEASSVSLVLDRAVVAAHGAEWSALELRCVALRRELARTEEQRRTFELEEEAAIRAGDIDDAEDYKREKTRLGR